MKYSEYLELVLEQFEIKRRGQFAGNAVFICLILSSVSCDEGMHKATLRKAIRSSIRHSARRYGRAPKSTTLHITAGVGSNGEILDYDAYNNAKLKWLRRLQSNAKRREAKETA